MLCCLDDIISLCVGVVRDEDGRSFSGADSNDREVVDDELTQLYTLVDKLLDGTDTDKEEAYNMLTDRQAQVYHLSTCRKVDK